MMALGTINSDYIEYMMGHITDTYHDITGLGIEHLRSVYASSGLSIRPKTQLNKIETIKALALTLGLDPDVILSKEALQKPHRTIIDGTYQTDDPTVILSKAIKKSLLEELKISRNLYLEQGSPGATVLRPLPRRWTCRGARLSRRSRLSLRPVAAPPGCGRP